MVDILSTFGGVSVVQCVKLMLKFFEFVVLLFDYFVYSPKSNLPETFYQVWALRRWGGRHNHRQTASCLLNTVTKIRTFSCAAVALWKSWICFCGHAVVIHRGVIWGLDSSEPLLFSTTITVFNSRILVDKIMNMTIGCLRNAKVMTSLQSKGDKNVSLWWEE